MSSNPASQVLLLEHCRQCEDLSVQDEATYSWAAGGEAGAGARTPRKTSWKLAGPGLLPALPTEESASKPGAKYTEAEFQQLLMGLKREHKEAVEKMRKEQDEALFKVGFPLQVTPTCFMFSINFPGTFRLCRN